MQQAESGQGYGNGIVKLGPEEILLNLSKGGLGKLDRRNNRT